MKLSERSKKPAARPWLTKSELALFAEAVRRIPRRRAAKRPAAKRRIAEAREDRPAATAYLRDHMQAALDAAARDIRNADARTNGAPAAGARIGPLTSEKLLSELKQV